MKNFLKRLCVLALVVAMCLPSVPMVAYAAEDPAEAVGFAKSRTDNGDGTYTISLQVVGDALVEEVTDSSANIVIVYDTSSSMTYCRAPQADGAYGGIPQNNTWGGTDYYRLYYSNTAGTGGSTSNPVDDDEVSSDTVLWYRTGNNAPWQQYTEKYADGTYKRFGESNTRADFAEDALHDFCQALSVYSGVQIAVVTFDNSARLLGNGWTTAANAATNFDDGTGDGYSLTYNQNTRWDLGLGQALTALGNANGNDTYVMLVTDGMYYPTTSGTTNVFTAAKNNSRSIETYDTNTHQVVTSGDNTTFFGVYAFGTNEDYLDDLVYFSQTGTNRSEQIGDTDTTGIEDNYYRAESSADFLAVIDDIFQKIVSALGIEQVSISDGTTSQVKTSSGEIAELLDVDESSYKYYLTIPMTTTTGGFTFTDNNLYQIKATESGNNLVMTWKDSTGSDRTATYVIEDKSGSVFKLKWTAKTDFYPAPPAAQLTTAGAVDWDLNTLGTLLEGVTYTYSFDVWPSQYSLDLLADLKNGYITYSQLPAEVKQYVSEDGSIATNTEATVTYTDSRTTEGAIGPVATKNPPPVATQAVETLAIGKIWQNVIDEHEAEPITLYVARDGAKRYEVELSEDSSPAAWSASAFISVGIMTVDTSTGAVVIKAGGHDYEFMESDAVSFHWEIDAPVVHPMKINNKPVNLVKVEDEDIPAGMTGDYYKDSTGTYYKITFTKGEGASAAAVEGIYMESEEGTSLTATNNRKSYLDVLKEVDGDAPEDALFSFTLQIDDPNGDDVWFSIWDAEAEELITGSAFIPSNAALETSGSAFTGYCYVKDNEAFTVNMKAGWSLRVLNLSTETICKVEEIKGSNFEFDKAEFKAETWTTKGALIVEETTEAAIENTFTIPDSNHAYTYTYTNKYVLGTVKIKKTVEGIDSSLISTEAAFTLDTADFTTTVAFSLFEEDPSDSAIKTYTVYDVPFGTYTISEEGFDVDGYKLTAEGIDDKSEATKGTPAAFEITNSYETATNTLIIQKNDEAEMTPSTAAFTISSTAAGFEDIVVTYGAFEDGTYRISLPLGFYHVVESGAEVKGYDLETEYRILGIRAVIDGDEDDTTPDGIDVEVDDSSMAIVLVTNTYTEKLGSIGIIKNLVGVDPDLAEDLEFVISGTAETGEEYTTTIAFSEFFDASEPPEKEDAELIDPGFDPDGEDIYAKAAKRELKPLPVDEELTSKWAYLVEGIPVGEYTISETGTAIDGYLLDESASTMSAIVTLEHKDGAFPPDVIVELTNVYALLGDDLTITKTVTGLGEDVVIPTFYFEVISYEEEAPVTVAAITPTEVDKAESITVPGLPAGKYLVNEIEPDEIEGYELVEMPEQVTVEIGGDDAPLAEFVNEYEATIGTVTIAKQTIGAALEDLPGDMTFILTGPKETVEIKFSEFDEEGVYTLENMPMGEYSILEVASSAAIPGLELSAVDYNKEKDTLEGGGEINFVVTNAYDTDTATIVIVKKHKGATPPDGTEFKITGDDYSTEVYYEDFTDGKIEVVVPTGSYTVLETESTAQLKNYDLEVEYSTKGSFKLETGDTFEVTITNTYTKETPPPPPILDTENHDAYIIGYPDGTVQPEGNITRAEVVTIFFRLLTDKSRSQYWETENDFDDVNVENWFNNAVSTMANAGIIKGYEDGKFKPYNNVTRAELATMAARFLTDTKGGSESKNYSDTEDSWAKAEIELASRYGIVNGYDDGTFKPNQAITRAEAMTLINRLLKRNPHEDHLLKNMVTWPDNDDESMWYYAQVQEATNGHTYTWGKDGNGKYEYWKAKRPNRDWSALEHEWSTANSK